MRRQIAAALTIAALAGIGISACGGSAPPAQTQGPASHSYVAAGASLGGDAYLTDDGGELAVSALGSNPIGTATFNVVVPSGGTYKLTIQYQNIAGPSSSAFTVNNGKPQAFTTPLTDTSGGLTSVPVSLAAGTNTIQFGGTGWAPDIYEIIVS